MPDPNRPKPLRRRPGALRTGEVHADEALPSAQVAGGIAPFRVMDCALIRISTGLKAQNLRELLQGVRQAPVASIYHHFWGRLLEPTFDEPEYGNDFAAWAARGLNDRALAERLGTIDPGEFADLEELRAAVIDAIEMRLDESEMVPWARSDQQFYFVWSQIVVFDTHQSWSTPEELRAAVPGLSAGSIFYHFIDARRRPPLGEDDLVVWLRGFGSRHAPACAALASVDRGLLSLADLRRTIGAALEPRTEEVGR